jgi:hypothetical protein
VMVGCMNGRFFAPCEVAVDDFGGILAFSLFRSHRGRVLVSVHVYNYSHGPNESNGSSLRSEDSSRNVIGCVLL